MSLSCTRVFVSLKERPLEVPGHPQVRADRDVVSLLQSQAPAVFLLHSSAMTLSLLHSGWLSSLLPSLSSTGLQWACSDHRLAIRGDLCWQLVWEGKVSVMRGWEGARGTGEVSGVLSGGNIRKCVLLLGLTH